MELNYSCSRSHSKHHDTNVAHRRDQKTKYASRNNRAPGSDYYYHLKRIRIVSSTLCCFHIQAHQVYFFESADFSIFAMNESASTSAIPALLEDGGYVQSVGRKRSASENDLQNVTQLPWIPKRHKQSQDFFVNDSQYHGEKSPNQHSQELILAASQIGYQNTNSLGFSVAGDLAGRALMPESPFSSSLPPSESHDYLALSHSDPSVMSLTPLGCMPSFPATLHAILNREELAGVISWMPHGRSWRVWKPREFEVRVIPLYFNHNKYSSFIRQAEEWGFCRITDSGPDCHSFYHQLFLRDHPYLVKVMEQIPMSRRQQRGSIPN